MPTIIIHLFFEAWPSIKSLRRSKYFNRFEAPHKKKTVITD